jgi:hypothetical protein
VRKVASAGFLIFLFFRKSPGRSALDQSISKVPFGHVSD